MTLQCERSLEGKKNAFFMHVSLGSVVCFLDYICCVAKLKALHLKTKAGSKAQHFLFYRKEMRKKCFTCC